MNLEENNEIWEKLKHKKNIYQVPEDYFEKLPQIIQARAVEPAIVTRRNFAYVLRFAIPVILIIIVALVTLTNGTDDKGMNVEELLSEVSTEDLVEFLSNSDITTDEILAEVDLFDLEFEFGGEGIDLLENNDLTTDELDDLLNNFTGSTDFL